MLGYTIDELKQTRVYQEAKEEGERSLVLRQLPRRVGALSPELVAQIGTLNLPQLEALGEALLDFSRPSDLTDWLQPHG
jgi:predicted transposase YdaD